MEYIGIFGKIKQRNEKTGYSSFFVRINNENILCSGITPVYPYGLPVKIEAEKTENELQVSSIFLDDTQKDALTSFLCSNFFQGMGFAQVEKLFEITGNDFFEYIKYNQFHNYPCAIQKCIDKIIYMLNFEKLYQFIVLNGGYFHNAKVLYKKYGQNTLNLIQENPYFMLNGGVDISICDKLAYKNKIKSSNKKRMQFLINYAFELNESNGNTYIEFDELCSLINKIENKTNLYKTHKLFVLESIINTNYEREIINNQLLIYRKNTYEAENNIVFHINRLLNTKQTLKNTISVDNIEKDCNFHYSDEQRKIFEATNESGVYIVTGGPGTGKTSVLKGILTKLQKEYPDEKILLCAPTGRAARRMQEVTGMEAKTINKLLDIRPYENETYTAKTELLSRFIIIDETSMIDTLLASRLLSSIKNGSFVMFLGDSDQLPSIGPGNLLCDFIQSGKIKTYYLSKIFRQGNGSSIIDNSKKIINGETSLLCDKSFEIKRFENEDALISELNKISSVCYSKDIEFCTFTPSRKRKFKSGTINLNTILGTNYRYSKGYTQGEFVNFGQYSFHEKDKIIFNKNNYNKNYYNGQTGYICSIQKINEEVRVSIKTEDDDLIEFSDTELEDIELGYAITAHKSQGGECNNAIIVVPKEPKSLLKRQLLYVEITRAKKKVIILSENNALETAISDLYEYKRCTRLKEKLKTS